MPAYITLARAKQSLGDVAGALEATRQAEQILPVYQDQPLIACQMATFLVRMWLAQDNLVAAEQCEAGGEDRPGYLRELESIALARLLVAQGRTGETMGLLERLLPSVEAEGRTGQAIELLVLKALALDAAGDSARALKALERALPMAEPEGYVRIFVDAGSPMRTLMRRAAAGGATPTYARRLLAAFDKSRKSTTTSSIQPGALDLLEPLTEREVEVLRLISGGMTNQEIADHLVISVATVKRHISNIYGKLGVNHRTQALARAHELKLL